MSIASQLTSLLTYAINDDTLRDLPGELIDENFVDGYLRERPTAECRFVSSEGFVRRFQIHDFINFVDTYVPDTHRHKAFWEFGVCSETYTNRLVKRIDNDIQEMKEALKRY
jgi:hypothetical protein